MSYVIRLTVYDKDLEGIIHIRDIIHLDYPHEIDNLLDERNFYADWPLKRGWKRCVVRGGFKRPLLEIVGYEGAA